MFFIFKSSVLAQLEEHSPN